jgi:hypothetical protein
MRPFRTVQWQWQRVVRRFITALVMVIVFVPIGNSIVYGQQKSGKQPTSVEMQKQSGKPMYIFPVEVPVRRDVFHILDIPHYTLPEVIIVTPRNDEPPSMPPYIPPPPMFIPPGPPNNGGSDPGLPPEPEQSERINSFCICRWDGPTSSDTRFAPCPNYMVETIQYQLSYAATIEVPQGQTMSPGDVCLKGGITSWSFMETLYQYDDDGVDCSGAQSFTRVSLTGTSGSTMLYSNRRCSGQSNLLKVYKTIKN